MKVATLGCVGEFGYPEYGWIVRLAFQWELTTDKAIMREIIRWQKAEFPDCDIDFDYFKDFDFKWGYYRWCPAPRDDIEGHTHYLWPGKEGRRGDFFGCNVTPKL